MDTIRKNKGVGSRSYRNTAKKRYITKYKINYADAKNRKDKTDSYYAKQNVKFAKSLKKYGVDSGYFKSMKKDVFGKNLTNKELSTIDMKEDKMIVAKNRTKAALSIVGTTALIASPYVINKVGKKGVKIGNTIYRFT